MNVSLTRRRMLLNLYFSQKLLNLPTKYLHRLFLKIGAKIHQQNKYKMPKNPPKSLKKSKKQPKNLHTRFSYAIFKFRCTQMF